ncbi:MAG: hypothetical protein JWQ67_419, partial [Marmoricola sp.]|nr:hypothetical protein [Marmoricola sp.]
MTGNLKGMDDRPDDNNPFKGTPFEQIFNA